MDTVFSSLCERIAVPTDVFRGAWDMWKTVEPEIDLSHKSSTGLHCCCIFVTASEAGNIPFTVTDLIKAANIHVTTFFSCMRLLRDVHILNQAILQRFIGIERRYCVSLALCHKLHGLIKSTFQDDEVPLNAPQDEVVIKLMNTEGQQYKTKLTWLLFLLTSNHMNSGCELLTAYHILVSCLQHVIHISPTFHLKSPFGELKDTEDSTSAILKELCDPSMNNLDEMNCLYTSVLLPYLQSLQSDHNSYDICQLESTYMSWYESSGGINELLFLTHDTNTVTENISTEENRPTEGHHSPSSVVAPVPDTPIKAALTSLQSLKKLLNSQSDQPSLTLQAYFDNCRPNPSECIKLRVAKFSDLFVSSYTNTLHPIHQTVGSQRYKQTTRLYYRVLQAILVTEEERLGEKDFTCLLNKNEFHTSLLACCAEIVITTYGISWNTQKQTMDAGESDITFPWVLGVFSLQSFYFYKVLESVIKAEPHLPKNVIRHLQGVENAIIESIAWQQDSPLYEVLAGGADAANVTTSPTTSTTSSTTSSTNPQTSTLPQPSTTDLYASPLPKRYPTNKNCESTCVASKSQGEVTPSRRSHSLTLFFNKVCRLGYHRLQALCTLLNIHNDLERKIWTCLEHCITKCPDLLKNRHLDQILMCCVYALCKVTDREIKFKVIVNIYKDLPHASVQTYKAVYIGDSQYDSIITFYNKIFSIVMKSFILQFSKNKPNSPSLSPVPKSLHSPSTASYSLPGRPNFHISPMKSLFKAPMSPSQMTPRSRVLYCHSDGIGFSEGSREKVRQINEEIAEMGRLSHQHGGSRSHKRLKFDDGPTQDSDMCLPVVTRTPVSN